MSKIRILLLTNRDSDNVGDQIIEATAISILKGIMANLGVPAHGYTINSRAAGIISKKYMSTGDPALLADARKTIAQSDVVVFGGAPLFNYSYQSFYLRTIKTLELAEEYGVPVLFSSIGVEPYDPDNPKCQQLREALTMPCVRQITTRDDIESARAYVEGSHVTVAHVSDPAVFADLVFQPQPGAVSASVPLIRRLKRIARRALASVGLASAPSTPSQSASATNAVADGRPRIGLVVTRSGIFKDNGISFSGADQRRFWVDVIEELTRRGYDYQLFTTGHFSDEVFLDAMVRKGVVPAAKATITVNSPEELTNELSACAGVIAYRLHASITSFAYGIPSVGLSWNFKVPYFYASVGHGDRALAPEQWTAQEAVDAIEKAMQEGVVKDVPFLMSVYETLFTGMRDIFRPEIERSPFTYDELATRLPRYGGTSEAQYREKVRRKMRRTYESYQRLSSFYSAHRDQASSA